MTRILKSFSVLLSVLLIVPNSWAGAPLQYLGGNTPSTYEHPTLEAAEQEVGDVLDNTGAHGAELVAFQGPQDDDDIIHRIATGQGNSGAPGKSSRKPRVRKERPEKPEKPLTNTEKKNRKEKETVKKLTEKEIAELLRKAKANVKKVNDGLWFENLPGDEIRQAAKEASEQAHKVMAATDKKSKEYKAAAHIAEQIDPMTQPSPNHWYFGVQKDSKGKTCYYISTLMPDNSIKVNKYWTEKTTGLFRSFDYQVHHQIYTYSPTRIGPDKVLRGDNTSDNTSLWDMSHAPLVIADDHPKNNPYILHQVVWRSGNDKNGQADLYYAVDPKTGKIKMQIYSDGKGGYTTSDGMSFDTGFGGFTY